MATASQQRVLRPGVVIADKYRVDEAIARGGFSVIYRGTHIEMERPVALKLLALDDVVKPSWLERFTREARLASQLTHPNTVTIFDYGQDPRGFLYIVMEWVEGESLYRHLRDRGPLSPREVAQITVQILHSLDEAHRRGFLHRDLKPSNIMLTHDFEGHDTIKVLDFGIAKNLEEAPDSKTRITHQGAFVGTPRYASPEQLDGRELTPAADIYSLGLLMWEALVGDPAVSSIQYGDCVDMHLGSEPWRLPDSVQCPPGLATILYRALAKPTDERYQSCRQMYRELEAWLDSEEARREGGPDFFAAGSGPVGLEASSGAEVDEEELFAGLGDDEPDESPLELRGPKRSRRTQRLRADREALGDDDTFERELLALADAASEASRERRRVRNQPSAPEHPGGPPPMPDESTPADDADPPRPAAPDRRAPPTRAAGRNPSSPPRSAGPRGETSWIGELMEDRQKLTVAVAAGAAVLIAGAAGFAWLSSGDDDAPEQPPGVHAGEDPTDGQARADEPSDESLDDGVPTYSAQTIWDAIHQSGWSRIGEYDTLEFSDVTQESARFRKKGKTVRVTVYQTKNLADAERYVRTADEPVQAIRFGKTAVQVAPGAKGNSAHGVYNLMSMLFELKAIAKDQADEKKR